MKMPDKVYEILKWLALVVLPGIGTCYSTLAEIWGWPWLAEIPATIQAVCLLIGAMIGISTAEYRRQLHE